MNNKLLLLTGLTLVFVFYLYQQYNYEKSNKSVVEGFMGLGGNDNSEYIYNSEGEKLINKLKDKYKSLESVSIPLSMNDYGKKCLNWNILKGVKQPKNLIVENQCAIIDDPKTYQCVTNKNTGELTSCNKMMEGTQTIKVPIRTTDKDVSRVVNNYKNLEDNFFKTNVDLEKIVNELIEKENRIIQQHHQIKQNKNIISLRKEKKDNLTKTYQTKKDAYQIDYQIVTKLRNKKNIINNNIQNVKYYNKLTLSLIIVILFGMVLMANIKTLNK